MHHFDSEKQPLVFQVEGNFGSKIVMRSGISPIYFSRCRMTKPHDNIEFARFVMHLLLFALVFAVGCQRLQQVVPRSHEADMNSLRDAEIAEEQAWNSKDLEKVLSFYADDATVMYPNMPAIVRKDALRAYEKQFFDDPSFTMQAQIISLDVAQSGDLGYTQGTETVTTTNPKTGKAVTDRYKWLTVRKKQADGSWKIVQDTGSSDLPLPSASK